jgi:hypothetical protein
MPRKLSLKRATILWITSEVRGSLTCRVFTRMVNAENTRPVAVVAVHGVGYCPPFSMARHISSMLLGLGRLSVGSGVPWPTGKGANPPYGACIEESVQIPLQPAMVSNAKRAQARIVPEFDPNAPPSIRIRLRFRQLLHYFAESHGYLAEVFSRRRDSATVDQDIRDRSRLGREFMRSQLAGYVSTQDGQAWDTIRLRTERSAPAGHTPRKVDIYECYWADLARPQGSILSFFNALYQLLFHLASLSRTALDYAAVEHIKFFRWRIASYLQAMAVRFLVIFIPILNLLLLIAGLTVLPLNIGLNHEYLAAALFGFFIFLALLFRPRRVPNHFGTWLLMLASAYIFGFVATWLPLRIFKAETHAGDVALAVEWWLIGEIILFLLMKRYDSVRRGAYRTAQVLGVASALLYFSLLARLVGTTPIPGEQASLWTMEIIFSILSLCWAAMLAFALGAWVVHLWCLAPLRKAAIRSAKRGQSSGCTAELATYARARAAFRTARLSLAVSASMISLVTVFLWAGAFSYANKSFNLLAGVEISYPPKPFRSFTSLIVPTAFEARWLVRKADSNKNNSGEASCGQDSPDKDNRCEAGTDAPAIGPACDALSARDQNTLQRRLDKVQQILAARGSLAQAIPEDLRSRLATLEEPAGIGHDRPYGCVYRVYLLENKVGIAGHTEFQVLARALLLASTSSGLPLMIILIVVAIVVLAWAVARSLIPDGMALNLATNRQCMQLGDWLSRGLDSTRAVTSLFWHSILTVPLVFGFLDYLYSRGELDFYFAKHNSVANSLGFAIAISLTMLNLVGSKLAISGAAIATIIYRYGRAPLDILLDVDSYLRTSPLENAPRARIAERYVSLLRYIAERKDPVEPQQPFYGSVVIVAHSLGALISADLLHFLKEEPDEALRSLGYGGKNQGSAEIKIRLLTFGNPLRQLLNRFFPHIYWWVREEPDNGVRPVAKAAGVPPDLAHVPTTPQVSDLGSAVKLWFNGYRSGDFVGRMLWSDRWYSRNKKGATRGQYPEEITIIRDAGTNTRAEMCIGLGGHNDYWNRTAPDMAEQLDKLIQM